MKTVHLQQGSPEWLAHRRTTRNASDAPAMMGASPYVTRAELVRQYATGVQREIDDVTQKRFDRGHEVEPVLRAYAENLIGEDLYPVTGVSDDGYLGASFDGVTLDETIILEAKQQNAEKRRMMQGGQIPPQDYWQIVHQFSVCESAQTCIYVVGDDTDAGIDRLEIFRSTVEADIPRLLAGWQQFDADVAAYVPEPEAATAVSRGPGQSLPTIIAQVQGSVTIIDNFNDFELLALDFLEHYLVRSPQTDEDFLTLDDQIKEMKKAEDALEAAGKHILAQIDSVNSAIRRKDLLKELIRRNRLLSEKLLTSEKESRKSDIVQNGAKAVRAHYDTINETLGEHRIQPPQSLMLDLGAVIKGKKSLASMKDAVDTAVAGFKIAASEQAERVRANVRVLEMEQGSHGVLFPDRVVLCATKTPEDLRNLIAARITQAQEDQQRREEEARQREAANAEKCADHATMAPVSPMSHIGQTGQAPAPVTQMASGAAGAKIKLGDISARISPLTITSDGLRQLGFEPAGRDRSATLYREADFPHMCHAMAKVLEQATQKKAA